LGSDQAKGLQIVVDTGVLILHLRCKENGLIASTCAINKATMITFNIKHYSTKGFGKKEFKPTS